MPDEIEQFPGSPKSPLQACFKNVVRDLNQKIFVVRGFSLVHDPEGSHYENVETRGGKRSMVDVGKNLNYDCQVLLYRCGEVFPFVIARHEVPKQSQIGQKEKKRSVIGHQRPAGRMRHLTAEF